MSARTQNDRKLDWETGRELERKDAEIARLREACRIALLHAPSIRLAPERRYTMKVLQDALGIKVRSGESVELKG